MSDTIKCPYCNNKLPSDHPACSTDDKFFSVWCDCGMLYYVHKFLEVDYEAEKDYKNSIDGNLVRRLECGELISQEKTNA